MTSPADPPAPVGASLLAEAAAAVCAERRRAARQVRLRCLAHAPVDPEGRVYRLEVGRLDDVDWTWEGAEVLRPQEDGEPPLWRGEVVELDEVGGHLYVAVEGRPPVQGRFVARPFDFLASLDLVLSGPDREPLAARVATALARAATGGAGADPAPGPCHPLVGAAWSRSWGALWGPPGTGKTHLVGEQVARAAEVPEERVLLVSTTNKATDIAAIRLGEAIRGRGGTLEGVVRLGAGARLDRYAEADLLELLSDAELDARRRISVLERTRERTTDPKERALVVHALREARRCLASARLQFFSPERRVVVTTAFGAMQQLVSEQGLALLRAGEAPFTTLVLDEAGLVSRAATAALSLLASRRVLLVGDPRQLAPITRMSRILPEGEARWLARSGLSHLDAAAAPPPNVSLLVEQHRMSAAVRAVVSRYQYEDRLRDAPHLHGRPFQPGPLLEAQPRAIWYVLDADDGASGASTRAERGPGHRSWVRRCSLPLLARLLAAHPAMRQGPGLFVTPFRAQAREVGDWLAHQGLEGWSASTVHSQQGAEADWVVFDTVHAGSTAWPPDEWRRLVNVGLSRAREVVILLASRQEMHEPYLQDLRDLLAPRVFRQAGGPARWEAVALAPRHEPSARVRGDPVSLGAQIEARKALRPVCSAEQERLGNTPVADLPRLVRGVAGSGKTLVLARCLARALADQGFGGRAWVVYANLALRSLVMDLLSEAWAEQGTGRPLPWERVFPVHVAEVLDVLEREHALQPPDGDRFDYGARARRLLDGAAPLQPRCDALFVDEAQDFGTETLELLFALVHPAGNPPRRPVMVFYDNAQDVFGRGTPRWSALGLDLVGRSTVMKEAFRATRPIVEYAWNVRCRLQDPDSDPDHRELVRRRRVVPTLRDGCPWWDVHFCEVEGPEPCLRVFPDRVHELGALAAQVQRWIGVDGVRPADIRVLCMGTELRRQVVAALAAVLPEVEAQVLEQRSEVFVRADDTVVMTTPHSFKGHDAEVVAVVGAERFVAGGRPLAAVLYVALTRARSLLYVSAALPGDAGPGRQVLDALRECHALLRSPPAERHVVPDAEEELEDLVRRLGPAHRGWLRQVLTACAVTREPVLDDGGAVLAEPLFLATLPGGRVLACFGHGPVPAALRRDLADRGVGVLVPGTRPEDLAAAQEPLFRRR